MTDPRNSDLPNLCVVTGRACPFKVQEKKKKPSIPEMQMAARLNFELEINPQVPLRYLIGAGTESNNLTAIGNWIVRVSKEQSLYADNISDSERYKILREMLVDILSNGR